MLRPCPEIRFHLHKLGIVGGADWGAKLFSNPDTVRAPDVCFVRAERLPGGRVPVRFEDGAPDLVVEVLSPSNRLAEIWVDTVGEA